eukprot:326812-Alexandrium_andersonii.AAC.1
MRSWSPQLVALLPLGPLVVEAAPLAHRLDEGVVGRTHEHFVEDRRMLAVVLLQLQDRLRQEGEERAGRGSHRTPCAAQGVAAPLKLRQPAP